ncbi:MAG: prephenate dehydrogenase/arogenate dehydrogenase family protein [Clostridia bacterium]|nr:prephenate dehydrogenase/arogenate dehydrogenase family protein [Clostridia bacterium]MBQ4250280.1 prephenate dehydrogenase/arogenate dehydrogenase family protein [Clostridia bacterium]
MNVGIVGLGLIGGSMAKSIKAHTLHHVAGVDLDAETMTFARLCGAIDEKLDETNLGECDIILIAVRPGEAVKWVIENAENIDKKTVVIDLCGVKRAVTERVAPIARERGFSYIGGHPMAGRERGGFVNSTDGMFDGASMILTPDERTDAALLERLKIFFTDIGFGSLTFTTPEEHDRVIAFTSQLAHITASAYVKSPSAAKRRGFSGGSFRDMTRVARLDEQMWTELFLDNADNLTEELEIFIKNLNEYLYALKAADSTELIRLLKEGRLKKAEAGGN